MRNSIQNIFSAILSIIGLIGLLIQLIQLFDILDFLLSLDATQFVDAVRRIFYVASYPFKLLGQEFSWSDAQVNNVTLVVVGFLFSGIALNREMGVAAPIAMFGLAIYIIARSANAIHEVKHDSGFLTSTGTDKLIEKLTTIVVPIRLLVVTLSLIFGAIFFDNTLSVWNVQLGPAMSSVIGGLGALLFSVIFLVLFIAWRYVLVLLAAFAVFTLVNLSILMSAN